MKGLGFNEVVPPAPPARTAELVFPVLRASALSIAAALLITSVFVVLVNAT